MKWTGEMREIRFYTLVHSYRKLKIFLVKTESFDEVEFSYLLTQKKKEKDIKIHEFKSLQVLSDLRILLEKVVPEKRNRIRYPKIDS